MLSFALTVLSYLAAVAVGFYIARSERVYRAVERPLARLYHRFMFWFQAW